MELDILPATVYEPRPGQVPVRSRLNTIMEEGQVAPSKDQLAARTVEADQRTTIHSGSPQASRDDETFAFRVSISSDCTSFSASTVDSRPLTWISSATGSSVETSTDIEDLGDPIGPEADDGKDVIEVMLVDQAPSTATDKDPGSERGQAPALRKPRYPSLLIPPARPLTGRYDFKKNEVVPPTPPPKIPLSPAVLSLLVQHEVGPSAPPSLDGSLSSDQLANSEAPPTPSIGTPDESPLDWDRGIQLNDEALATLHALSNDNIPDSPERGADSCDAQEPEHEPAPELAPISARSRSFDRRSPISSRYRTSLAQLDIPSPGGFFSSLGPGTRHTWCPSSAHPPSSTTAERFYNCPWNRPAGRIAEQIVEVDDVKPAEPETACLVTPRPFEAPSLSDGADATAAETSVGLEDQEGRIDPEDTCPAEDRIASWLSAQQPPANVTGIAADALSKDSVQDAMNEFDIQFGEVSALVNTTGAVEATVKAGEPDAAIAQGANSVFWRVFSALARVSYGRDTFVHRQERFDALFTKRMIAQTTFYDALRGKYRVPLVKAVTDKFEDEPTVAAKEAAQLEMERKVVKLVTASHWHVMALKYLNGGQLLTRPAVRMLKSVSGLSEMMATPPRVLDLAGTPVCDWAWQCANDYSPVEVHTVPATTMVHDAHLGIHGPPNHFQAAASRLWELPFPDDHFDVVSARSLHMHLKSEKPIGEQLDEYDLCLRECMRCLKPGGYLEFSLLDSDLLDAGPVGTAMSVEFGFKLKTRGYDPAPTRSWLQRLERAGFVAVNQMWVVLPLGAPYSNGHGPAEAEEAGAATAVTKGPQLTDIDAVTGLVGLRAWEQWMLLLQREIDPDTSALHGVTDVVLENRNYRAGWKCLNGSARKPV